VLTGSVQRELDMLRVPLQLIDASELRQIRSHLITTDRATGFVLQDEVMTAVEDLLEIELAPAAREALQAGGTSSAEAAELFLEARGTAVATATEEELTRAMALYRSALDLDPRFADAMVELANICHHRYELNDDAIWLEHGVAYAERAAEVDPTLPAAHAVAGRCELARHDFANAVASLQRAIELDPLYLEAYTDLAAAYEEMDQPDLASATIERAIRTGPDDWQTHFTIGRFYLFDSNDIERAVEAFSRVVELNPGSAIGYAALGATLFAAGDYEGARSNLERAVEIGELYWALSNLATLEFYEGRPGVAADLYRRALAVDDSDSKVWNNLAEALRASGGSTDEIRTTYERAAELATARLREQPDNVALLIDLASYAVHLGQPATARERLARAETLGIERIDLLFGVADTFERLGERELALGWLGRALEAGLPPSTVERYPDFDALRADPRYQELVEAATSSY
jgi:tetratricopeptide (TPR) repeat protein